MVGKPQNINSSLGSANGNSASLRLLEEPPEPSMTNSGPPVLSEAQLTHLREFGFLPLQRIVSQETVAEIYGVFEILFASKVGYKEGAHFNLVGSEDDPNSPKLPTIFSPQNYAESLRKSEFFVNAKALAHQILGEDARLESDLVLMKPPVDGPATPWHQDEAFRNPKFDYNEVSIWMPLQAVNQINGCMEFIPGTNRGEVLPHRTPNNDPTVHILECYEGFDPATAVACPIPAGGCSLHCGRTVHGSGPNRSDKPRYAYVLVFNLPPTPALDPKSRNWLKDKDTAHLRRMRHWLRRGGFIVALWREIKHTPPREYGRVISRMWRRAHSLGPLWKKKV